MAHEYTTWAWAQDIPSGCKFVLVALADSANADGYSWPGQKRLARMTGQDRRSVQRHLVALEADGYLRREARYRENGSRTSDGYWLPPKDDADRIGTWPVAAADPVDNLPRGGRHSVQGGAAPCRQGGGTMPRQRTITYPSPNRQSKNTSPNGDALAKVNEGENDGQVVQAIADAYNEHRGPLPAVRVLGRKREAKIRGFVREFPTPEDAVACMAMAAANVATDTFWQERRYGLDNLLADHRAIQKAEAVVESNGHADARGAKQQRMMDALRRRRAAHENGVNDA